MVEINQTKEFSLNQDGLTSQTPLLGKRAILLKVFIQTVWVVIDDDTETVTEHTDSGITIPAKEWPTFYQRWADDFAALQESVAASDD